MQPARKSSVVQSRVYYAVHNIVWLALAWRRTAHHSSPKALTLYGGELGNDSLGHKGKVESTAESTVDFAIEPTRESTIKPIVKSTTSPKLTICTVEHWGVG